MAADLFYLPFLPILSTRGLPSGAAEAYFYLSGTTTLAPIYADAGMTTPLTNPVVADNFGRLPDIYLNDALTYRFYVVDVQGQQLYNVDPYIPAHPFQGPPGGNIMATGTMVGLAQMTVPAGTNVIRTTGFYADNDGGDGFYYLAPAGTMGGVGSTADNKVAIPMSNAGVHNALSWGLRPDATTIGGSSGCTDNLPLLQKLLTYGQTAITGVYNSGPHVRFPGTNGYYYFSSTIKLRQAVIFEGDGYGMQTYPQAQASKLTWPAGVVGLQLERYDTDGSNGPITPILTGADGAIIRGLGIYGGGYTGASGAHVADVLTALAAPTYHAIWSKVRFRLENCVIASWTGHGVYINATSGATGATRGNANEFYLASTTVQSVGGWGFWIQGSDANAGTTIGLGTSACGLGGLADVSFLGNMHYGYHNDGCGILSLGLSVYNNIVYLLANKTQGSGASGAPPSNTGAWLSLNGPPTFYITNVKTNTGTGVLGSVSQSGGTQSYNQTQLRMTATSATAYNVTDYLTGALLGTGTVGTAATFYGLTFTITGTPVAGDSFTLGTSAASWSPNINWTISNALFSDNANSRSLFAGCYFEGGSPTPHVAAPAMLVQSQGQPTQLSSYMFNASGVGGYIASFGGVGAFQYLASGDLRGGYSGAYIDIANINWISQSGGTWRLTNAVSTNTQGNLSDSLTFSYNGAAGSGPQILGGYVRSALTAAENAGTFWTYPGLLVGQQGIKIDSGTATPTTGQSRQGDIRYNSAATATGIPGWSCTTTGTNGSTSVWTAWPVL